MKIFITGGAGFIGSHVVDALVAEHHQVTVFDNFNSSVRNNPPDKAVTVIQGDICDIEHLTNAMKQHDAVIAMACAHVRLSFTNPIGVHTVNATGTLNTLLAAQKNGIKRFLYTSSSEVYGSAEDTIMSETHQINPTTIYGASKYVGELYTNQFGHFEGMKTTVVRPFNTYGPRSHFDGYYGEVIPRMTIRALSGEPPLINGDGTQTRDFTYVSDTAKGIVDILFCDQTIDTTVNIAYGKEVSVKDIAEIIVSLVNPSLEPIHNPPRPNDVARHAADTTKAQQYIQWNPQVRIHEGLKRYIEWFKQTYPDVSTVRNLVPDKNW